MRPKSACVVCRKRRRKCIRSFQGTSCDFCIARNVRCVVSQEVEFPEDGYEPIIPRQWHTLTHKSKLLPPMDLCEELVELYFRYVHVSFHVLFHKPSFVRSFKDGSLPKVLLLAVIGMSARFSDHEHLAKTSPQKRGRPFIKEAERLLDLHKTCLTTIQACLLLGASAVAEGSSTTESIYFSIACRMGMLLDLPNAPVTTRVQQEVNFRVWWALYETDTWSSTATRLPKMMPLRDVPLPMPEKRFTELSKNALPTRHLVPKHAFPDAKPSMPPNSLIAHSIVVNQIFTRVDEVNTQTVSGDLQGVRLLDAVERVSLELASWESNLPDNMVNTPENLAYWTSEGVGNIFVIVHMNYYHLCQLLHYQFLYQSSKDSDEAHLEKLYAQKCAGYATDLCKLIHLASEKPGAELLNSIVGHVLTVASTILLHTLLHSHEADQADNARRLLERNFQLLTRLKQYWPCIDISFSRFEAFHRACLRSQDESLFRMDRWALQFMLEFATPITERYDDEVGDEHEQRQFDWSPVDVEANSYTDEMGAMDRHLPWTDLGASHSDSVSAGPST